MRGWPFTIGSSPVLRSPSGPGSRRVICRFQTSYGRPGVVLACDEKALLLTNRTRTPMLRMTSRSYDNAISCSTGALTPLSFGDRAGRFDVEGSVTMLGQVVGLAATQPGTYSARLTSPMPGV